MRYNLVDDELYQIRGGRNVSREQTCCFTGHRPEKLTCDEREARAWLRGQVERAVGEGKRRFITGMARGVDLWGALAVIELQVQHPQLLLTCALPYPGFERNWAREWREIYWQVLNAAAEIHAVRPAFCYSAYRERNEWMVDHSSVVIGVCGGARGGTRNTLLYARNMGLELRLMEDEGQCICP